MSLSNLQENHTPYQYHLPLDIILKADEVFEKDDPAFVVIDAVRESGIIKYVRFNAPFFR